MFNDKKFYFLPYAKRKVWSKRLHKYYLSDNIGNQVWGHEDKPLIGQLCCFEEIFDYLKENRPEEKTKCPLLMRFETNQFPVKEHTDINKWNGVICVDLDFGKSEKIRNWTQKQHDEFYNRLDFTLLEIAGNNYAYIEHSSSKIGFHLLFYFDCEPTESNYNKFSRYIYELFRYKIDAYIENFSSIFTNPENIKSNGVSELFDEVYKRPYQKFYLTGYDCKFYNCSGKCEDIKISVVEEIKTEESSPEFFTNIGKVNVKHNGKNKKYNLDYNDRFFVLTALKKYVKDQSDCYKIWYDFCHKINTYKNYTVTSFINEFEKNWDGIDTKQGHITVLKKYGFDIDDSEINYYLNDGQYLSDIIEDIIETCDYGLNMLVAGTGVGKTQAYINLNEKYSNITECYKHKPILIIEPLNSIIKSKYDELNFRIVTGSKQIGNLNNYECIITNYNHLVSYKMDGIEIKQNIDDFFKQFELVVIDESHIMLKDIFRAEVLVPFLQTINNIKNTKVILQTATQMFEKSILNIKKTFIVHKNDNIKKKIIFRYDEKFKIQNITCLVDYYIKNKKKVYIYWNNGSLQNMKQFKKCYHDSDKVIIYHKRNNEDINMQYVDKFHNIDNFNIIMSSVYFGVGNDLLDNLEDVAVIIIGNNPWQEDIQAIGRWRKVKNIECCIILNRFDNEFVESTTNSISKFSNIFDKNKFVFDTILKDITNRDKSVIINRMAYEIKNKMYSEILAKMKASYDYSCQFKVKCEEFEKRGYDVRKDIKNLEYNIDWMEKIKEYKNDLKNIRNNQIKEMINGNFEYSIINEDSKLVSVARIIKSLKTRNLLQYCNLKKFKTSHILKYGTFLDYYKRSLSNINDYTELFSILWVKKQLKKYKPKEIIKTSEGIELKMPQYIMMYGYLIWLSYRKLNDKEIKISYNYFKKFNQICSDMVEIEDELIEQIFKKEYYNESYNEFYKDFFKINEDIYIKETEGVTIENIYNHIKKLGLEENYYADTIKFILEYYQTKNQKNAANFGKIGGKVGGKKTKRIKITEKFIKAEKYNLKIGQEFDSCKLLAEFVKKSLQTLSSWNKKGWICEI